MGRLFTYMVKAASGEQPALSDDDAAFWDWVRAGAIINAPGYKYDWEQRLLNAALNAHSTVRPLASSQQNQNQNVLDSTTIRQRAKALTAQRRARGTEQIVNALYQGDTLKPWMVDYLQAGFGITPALLNNTSFRSSIRDVDANSMQDVKKLFEHRGIEWNPDTADYRVLSFIKAIQDGIEAGNYNNRSNGQNRPGFETVVVEGVPISVPSSTVNHTGASESDSLRSDSSSSNSPAPTISEGTPGNDQPTSQPQANASVQAPPIVGYKAGDPDGSIRDAYHSMFTPPSATPTPQSQVANTAPDTPVAPQPQANASVQAPPIVGYKAGDPDGSIRDAYHSMFTPPSATPTPVQVPPMPGTWNDPSFTQSSRGISFYNLPAGMSQEQAQQIWNATGRAAAEAYLAATGRRGENIQVSPDGSTIRLMNSRGGYTELNTALSSAPPEQFDAKQITPDMRARYAQDPAMRRGLIAMQGANGRVYRAPGSSSLRRSRPSVTAAPVRNRARWADISVDTDNYGAFERAYADLMHRRTGGGYAQQGWQQQAADWGNRQYTNWQRVQGKTREQMSDNERRWYNAVNKHENHTLYSAIQAREAEERRKGASSPQNVMSAPTSYTAATNVRNQGRSAGRRA